MAILSDEEIKKRFKVTRKEVTDFLKEKGRPIDKRKLRARVRNRLRAAKIAAVNGKEITNITPTAEWQIIYGHYRVGGTITYLRADVNTREWLYLVVTVAAHEVEAIDTLWLDNEQVIFDANGLSTHFLRENGQLYPTPGAVQWHRSLGGDDQPANSLMANADPSFWSANHRQRGHAHVGLILRFDPIIFPNGIPNIEFFVRGKKVFDPASQTNIFSENGALIIADLLRNGRHGFGIPDGTIDLTNTGPLKVAADTCAELVQGVETLHPRYSINAAYKTSESITSTIEAFQVCTGGTVFQAEGKWRVEPGRWTEPVLSITEDDILSPINIRSETPREERFNSVRGTHVGLNFDYEEVEFPAYVNPAYVAQDGGRIFEDIDFPYVRYHEACQRLGKLMVEENRAGLMVDFLCTLKAYKAIPRDRITITNSRMGWNAKTFRVMEIQVITDADAEGNPFYAVALTAIEDAPDVWAWQNGTESGRLLTPNTDLPNAFETTGLGQLSLASGTDELILTSDGTIISRIKVSWPPIQDFFVTQGGRVEIQYKRSAPPISDVWEQSVSANPENNYAHIAPVQDGANYDVRARSVNASGFAGPWSSFFGYPVIGKTQPPSDVTGFRGEIQDYSVRLFWEPIPDADRWEYEIRIGGIGVPWETAQRVAIVRGEDYISEARAAGEYQFLIKAIDTSGNYSINASGLAVNIAAPAAVTLTAQIEGEFAIFNWNELPSFYAIEEYEFYVPVINENTVAGQTFSQSNLFTSLKGTSLRIKVDWNGARKFWVRARDVSGTLGAVAEVTVVITPPSAPTNLRAEVIDNNVLLYWSAPAQGSLPIAFYRIFTGPTINTATLKGETKGTFQGFFESSAGEYRYWLVAYNTAGFISPAAGVTAKVDQPPDYILVAQGIIDPREGDLAQNIYIDGFGVPDSVINPVNPTSGIGVPIGLLLTLTNPGSGGGTGAESGEPLGLLITITEP